MGSEPRRKVQGLSDPLTGAGIPSGPQATAACAHPRRGKQYSSATVESFAASEALRIRRAPGRNGGCAAADPQRRGKALHPNHDRRISASLRMPLKPGIALADRPLLTVKMRSESEGGEPAAVDRYLKSARVKSRGRGIRVARGRAIATSIRAVAHGAALRENLCSRGVFSGKSDPGGHNDIGVQLWIGLPGFGWLRVAHSGIQRAAQVQCQKQQDHGQKRMPPTSQGPHTRRPRTSSHDLKPRRFPEPPSCAWAQAWARIFPERQPPREGDSSKIRARVTVNATRRGGRDEKRSDRGVTRSSRNSSDAVPVRPVGWHARRHARSASLIEGHRACTGHRVALARHPIFVRQISPRFIAVEERKLEMTFGVDYLQYKAGVRRWL